MAADEISQKIRGAIRALGKQGYHAQTLFASRETFGFLMSEFGYGSSHAMPPTFLGLRIIPVLMPTGIVVVADTGVLEGQTATWPALSEWAGTVVVNIEEPQE